MNRLVTLRSAIRAIISSILRPRRRASRRLLAGSGLFAIAVLAVSLDAQIRRGEPAEHSIAVVLRWEGFEPPSITMPPGKNFIVVFNRTGLDEVDLKIQRTGGPGRSGEVLAQRPSRRTEWNWNELVNLPVGEYEIREANHPQWVFRLSVEPNAWAGRRTRATAN